MRFQSIAVLVPTLVVFLMTTATVGAAPVPATNPEAVRPDNKQRRVTYPHLKTPAMALKLTAAATLLAGIALGTVGFTYFIFSANEYSDIKDLPRDDAFPRDRFNDLRSRYRTGIGLLITSAVFFATSVGTFIAGITLDHKIVAAEARKRRWSIQPWVGRGAGASFSLRF